MTSPHHNELSSNNDLWFTYAISCLDWYKQELILFWSCTCCFASYEKCICADLCDINHWLNDNQKWYKFFCIFSCEAGVLIAHHYEARPQTPMTTTVGHSLQDNLQLSRKKDGSVRGCSNSISNTLELLQSRTKPMNWWFKYSKDLPLSHRDSRACSCSITLGQISTCGFTFCKREKTFLILWYVLC